MSRRVSRVTADSDLKRTLPPQTEGDYVLLAMADAPDQALQLAIPSASSDISSVLGTPTSLCHTPQNFASGFDDVQVPSPILSDTLSGRSRSSDWGSPFASKTKLDFCQRSLSSPNLLSGAFINTQSLAISLRGPTGDWEAVIALYDASNPDSLLNQHIADRLGLESIRIPIGERAMVMTPFGPIRPHSVIYNIGLKEGGGVGGNPIAANIVIAPFNGTTVDIIIGRKLMEKLRNAGMGGGMQSLTGSPWAGPNNMASSGADFSSPRYPGDQVWLPDPNIDFAGDPIPYQPDGIPVPFPGHLSCISTTDQMYSGVCGGGPEGYVGWNWTGFPPVNPADGTEGTDMDDNLAALVGMNRM